MEDYESILDYFGKLSRIVIELKSLGEKISNADLSTKLLRSVSSKFDSITMEEKALLARALGKNKKKDSSNSSQARGKGRGRGRGRGCGRGRAREMMIENSDDNERPRDKSLVTCYNCQKKGHYANECRFPRKEKPKVGKEKAIIAEENSSDNSLLMAFEDSDVLLQGISQFELMNDMWSLDMGATSHMTSESTLFFELDESYKEGVRFGDD
ncbi:unnamed protein product [Spirodela intermedia]|uniref:CCHC-type domain-containing protein n=1 Tax=Spirodela intermedia TaxID=51605 RepID=A0A7I8IY17_SPIIN|nr:unnamed protein product [Spirodela intermedia]CAA6662757.1 unnamed protein product [Spirodela intermedia]